jgi:hypothetical protein
LKSKLVLMEVVNVPTFSKPPRTVIVTLKHEPIVIVFFVQLHIFYQSSVFLFESEKCEQSKNYHLIFEKHFFATFLWFILKTQSQSEHDRKSKNKKIRMDHNLLIHCSPSRGPARTVRSGIFSMRFLSMKREKRWKESFIN